MAINSNLTRLIEITDLNSDGFYRCMDLYQNLFPPEEQKSLVSIKTLLERRIYRLFGLQLGSAQEIIGFALIMMDDEPNFLFIDNLAIDPARQGQGLGSDLIRQLSTIQGSQSLGVFLEVEKPELAIDETDRGIRTTRIQFYRRLGFVPLGNIDYLFPVKNDEPLPLLLMFKPAPQVTELTADTLKQMIKSVYHHIHADVENREDILQSFINTIRNQHFPEH